MNCLVTGGRGFIGSHLVDRLLEDGHNVTVLDKANPTKYDNAGAKYVQGDICGSLDDLFKSQHINAVFHLAAIPSVQYSIREPKITYANNVGGTLNVLKAAKAHGVKRFVFSSSAAVYGKQSSSGLVETLKTEPSSPYGSQKLESEGHLHHFNDNQGMKTIALRYFNVFGPRQNPKGDYASLIPRTIANFREGTKTIIFGDGNQTRDFIYISDVVQANIAALTTANFSCYGTMFNIGTGNKLTVKAVVKTIKDTMQSRIEPVHGQAVEEVRDCTADISKARMTLGWSPQVFFQQGIQETVKYF